MPNRLFQSIVNQMRDSIDRNIGVVDESGSVIACSELGQIGEIERVLFPQVFLQVCRPVLTDAPIKHSEIPFIPNMPYF